MRILIDLQSCQSGSRRRGIGRYVASITIAILHAAKGRHSIHVLLSDLYPDHLIQIRRDLEGLLPPENIVLVSLPQQVASAVEGNDWRTRAAELALAKVVEDLAPDVYFNPSLFEGFREPTVASIERVGCRTATTLYDLIPYADPEIYLGDPVLRRAYEDKLTSLRRCDAIFAISEFTRTEAIRLLDLPPDRVVHVPLAASSQFVPIAMDTDRRAQLLARYGIRGRFVITTAPLEPRKNLHGLLAGFSHLAPSQRANLTLVLVGQTDEAERRKIADMAKAQGLSHDDYVITGFVPDEDLAALYSCCELMVFPSLSEGFGLPPLEAMACGAAVATSDLTSLPEVVGRKDVLFDPHDPIDMARVITKILTDGGHREELKAYGIIRTRQFSWRKSARTILSTLERLPARRKIHVPDRPGFSAGARVGVIAAVGMSPKGRGATALRSLLRDLGQVCTVEWAMVGGDMDFNPAPEIPRHDLSTLMMLGGRFDRLLYFAEAEQLHSIAAYVTARPGAVVVTETAPRQGQTDGLSPTQQADVFAWGGFRALATVGEDQGMLEQVAGSMFRPDIPILAEAGSRLIRNGRAIPFEVPTRVRSKSRQARRNDDGMIEAILEVLAAAPAPTSQDRLDPLTGLVNGVSPNVHDLDELALAVSRNAEIRRPPKVFLDISGLTTVRGAYFSLSRRLIRDVLVSGTPCQPIQFKQSRAVSANRLAGRLLGFPDFPQSDHDVVWRSGDRVVRFDLLGGAAVDAALVSGLAAQGVSVAVAVMETMLIERPDLSAAVARAVMDAAGHMQGRIDGEILLSAAATERPIRPSRNWSSTSPKRGGEPAPTWLVFDRVDIPALQTQNGVMAPDRVRLLQNDVQQQLADLRASAPPKSSAGAANYTVLGHVGGAYSLAMVNRAIARALEAELGNRVAFAPYETTPVNDLSAVPAAERPAITRLTRRALPADGVDVVISHHYPVLPPPETPDLALALFHWEETVVPLPVIENLQRHFSAVLAPSQSVRKALLDSGLHIPVALMGLPSELEAFKKVRGPKDAHEKVFLHVSSCFPRKGVDILLKAWVKAFSSADSVRLVIKTFPNPHNDVEDQVERLHRDHKNLAPIDVISLDMEQDALAKLYEIANVVVLPTRGEGYNLPALEAMASGTPLIVSGYGGQSDFCGPAEARLLEYDFTPSASHVAGGNALWVEPSVEDLILALREQIDLDQTAVVETRRQKAIERAREVGRRGAWVAKLQSVTTDLLHSPITPRPRMAWVTSWNVRCGIAEYSGFLLNHAPPEARATTVVLSDYRTPPESAGDLLQEAVWKIGDSTHLGELLEAMDRHRAEAVVIQHQDGLIRWTVLGELLQDERLLDRVVVVFLHAAGNIQTLLTEDERQVVLTGLQRATRVVVHNLSDLNLLKSYGLVGNVTLLPHGAMPGGEPPGIRPLPPSADPIIGCHGFFLSHKRIDRLISTLPILRRQWPGVRLRLVNANYPGESEHLIAAGKALAASLKVDDAIDWHTDFLPVEEIRDILAGCDIVVLPYDHSRDSASGAVRVAMSSLAPVLTTDVNIFGELRGVVAQVDSNEPTRLAAAIGALLEDQRRRTEIQENMKTWLDIHDWSRISHQLDGMIRGLFSIKQRGWD